MLKLCIPAVYTIIGVYIEDDRGSASNSSQDPRGIAISLFIANSLPLGGLIPRQPGLIGT